MDLLCEVSFDIIGLLFNKVIHNTDSCSYYVTCRIKIYLYLRVGLFVSMCAVSL